jgi:hypothetical protein
VHHPQPERGRHDEHVVLDVQHCVVENDQFVPEHEPSADPAALPLMHRCVDRHQPHRCVALHPKHVSNVSQPGPASTGGGGVVCSSGTSGGDSKSSTTSGGGV